MGLGSQAPHFSTASSLAGAHASQDRRTCHPAGRRPKRTARLCVASATALLPRTVTWLCPDRGAESTCCCREVATAPHVRWKPGRANSLRRSSYATRTDTSFVLKASGEAPKFLSILEETYSVRVFQRKVTSRRCAVSLRERTKGPATPPHIPTTWEGVAGAKLGET